ncbi:hypothetical protein [Oceaniglobus roseus]|uniref:hypothetical protein n=1 Tax=Oceaniglobus roseus TaxID=1737570 RepID=UPI000C7F780D|nr:hypothetical protein [Kandeliimicrobium roseum]
MPTRLGLAALACVALLACPLRAQQTPDDLRSSMQLVVSERLRTFSLARGLSPEPEKIGIAQDLKALLLRQGFYLDRSGPEVLLRRHAVYPLLTWDPNMNGGAENRTLNLGGLIFQVNEDRLARGGLAAGIGYEGQVRLGWSQGRYVELRAQAEASHAPRSELTRTEGRLTLCSRNHVTGWSFADLCLRQTRIDRDITDRFRREAELSVSQLFQTGGTAHEVTLGFGRALGADVSGSFVSVGLDSAGDGMASRLKLTLSEPPQGTSGMDAAFSAEARWNMAGHVAGLGLSVARSAPSPFLGLVRRDLALGLNALYEIRENVLLNVSFSTNRSTVDFFDSSGVQVQISFVLP